MRRIKWMIMNLIFISIVLVMNFYHNGYYLSKKQCILETMRSLYIPEGEQILELCNGNYCKTLFDHGDSFSLVGTKQIGFLYQTGSTSGECRIDKTTSFFHWMGYTSDFGTYLVIYRNDERIAEVQVELNTGDIFIMNDWKSNYVVFLTGDVERKNAFGIYRVYDEVGNLIEEIDYFSE